MRFHFENAGLLLHDGKHYVCALCRAAMGIPGGQEAVASAKQVAVSRSAVLIKAKQVNLLEGLRAGSKGEVLSRSSLLLQDNSRLGAVAADVKQPNSVCVL